MHSENTLLVEMRGIVKRFPGILANDSVDFQLLKGEVHALLGENGAGKTTLMNILSGLYRSDSGEILINGEPVEYGSTRDAIRAGIGMVHQHFQLVDNLSVAENSILGMKRSALRMGMGEIERKVADLGEEHGLKVDPRALIWQLSIGEQQRVEILKLLFRDVNVLILDEPTSVLTPQEAQVLSMIIRRLASAGRGIIYISHKLPEILEVADRITVLRAGRRVTTVSRSDVDKRRLAELMIDKEVPSLLKIDRVQSLGEVLLEARNLHVRSDRLLPAVRDLSIKVHRGELVGIAGVAGNGQRELAEALAGLRAIESGHILIGGEDFTGRSSREIVDAGLSLIPEDRREIGLIPSLGLLENVILKCYRRSKFSHYGFMKWNAATRYLLHLIEEFSIQVARQDNKVWKLSGGNQQRLLLAREITSGPRIIVAAHPTSGLDVQAQTEIESLLIAQRNKGLAILLISEDLDEIMALADRIAVIYEGRIVGEVSTNEVTKDEIGLMMMGG